MANVRPPLSELQLWLLSEGRALLQNPSGTLQAGLSAAQRNLLDQQLEWRKRSRPRFPDPSLWLWSDRSLSQASDWFSARFKASIFPNDELVLDACCGAGVDTVALAHRGPVVALDIDAWMVALAQSNASAHGLVAAGVSEAFGATSLRDAKWMHIDPDRRNDRGKQLDAREFSPRLDEILEVTQKLQGTIIKVAPSTLLSEATERLLSQNWTRVWLGSRGECQQQLLVGGGTIIDKLAIKAQPGMPSRLELAPYSRLAVVLKTASNNRSEVTESLYVGQGHQGTAPRLLAEQEPQLGRFIYDLDATLFASKLHRQWADEYQLTAVTSEFGFYTGDRVWDTEWASRFEVQEILPWDDRKVRKWLAARSASCAEVKSRLVRLDANSFHRRYRRADAASYSFLVTRIGNKTRCLVCRRATSTSDEVVTPGDAVC